MAEQNPTRVLRKTHVIRQGLKKKTHFMCYNISLGLSWIPTLVFHRDEMPGRYRYPKHADHFIYPRFVIRYLL